MICSNYTTSTQTICSDVEHVKYCQEIEVKTRVCVNEGKDAAERLLQVIEGTREILQRTVKGLWK